MLPSDEPITPQFSAAYCMVPIWEGRKLMRLFMGCWIYIGERHFTVAHIMGRDKRTASTAVMIVYSTCTTKSHRIGLTVDWDPIKQWSPTPLPENNTNATRTGSRNLKVLGKA